MSETTTKAPDPGPAIAWSGPGHYHIEPAGFSLSWCDSQEDARKSIAIVMDENPIMNGRWGRHTARLCRCCSPYRYV